MLRPAVGADSLERDELVEAGGARRVGEGLAGEQHHTAAGALGDQGAQHRVDDGGEGGARVRDDPLAALGVCAPREVRASCKGAQVVCGACGQARGAEQARSREQQAWEAEGGAQLAASVLAKRRQKPTMPRPCELAQPRPSGSGRVSIRIVSLRQDAQLCRSCEAAAVLDGGRNRCPGPWRPMARC